MNLKDKNLLNELFSSITVLYSPSSEPFTNFSLYLQTGFEAFSKKASETWEHRWTMELRIPGSESELLGKREPSKLVLRQKHYESDEDFIRACINELKRLKKNRESQGKFS